METPKIYSFNELETVVYGINSLTAQYMKLKNEIRDAEIKQTEYLGGDKYYFNNMMQKKIDCQDDQPSETFLKYHSGRRKWHHFEANMKPQYDELKELFNKLQEIKKTYNLMFPEHTL